MRIITAAMTTLVCIVSSCSKENDLFLFKKGKIKTNNEVPAIEFTPILSQADYDSFELTRDMDSYDRLVESPADLIDNVHYSLCNTCNEPFDQNDSGDEKKEVKTDPCDPTAAARVEAKGNTFLIRYSWKAEPKDKCIITASDTISWVMCPGVSFDVLDGKPLVLASKELDPLLEAYENSECKSYFENILTSSNQNSGTQATTVEEITIYASATGFGQPCQRTAIEDGFLNGCKDFMMRKRGDKVNVEIVDRTKLVEKEPRSYWYDGGKMSVSYNGWTGEFTYINGQTPPSYVISKKDGATTTGTIKVEEAKNGDTTFSLTHSQKATPKSPLEILFPHRGLLKSRSGGI